MRGVAVRLRLFFVCGLMLGIPLAHYVRGGMVRGIGRERGLRAMGFAGTHAVGVHG